MSEKQLSFDCAMKIVNKQKWIQIKDIERLEKFIQNQQATISALKEENDILKQKLRKNYIANKQYEELQRLKEENEKLLHQNEKYEMEIRALNSKIKDWYNDSAIAKLYEKEQDKTEMLEKAYEECNAKWEKLFAENKKLKHQLAQIPPKIKEVWIE